MGILRESHPIYTLKNCRPLIGGELARPADRFPYVFGHSKFWKTYPYFLPCAIPATVSALSWIAVVVFLKEVCCSIAREVEPTNQPQTTTPQVTFSQLLSRKKRQAVASSALRSSSVSSSSSLTTADLSNKPVPIRGLFIRRVLIAAGSYAGIALVDIAFRTVQPVFFSTPISLGGLGLDIPTIGTILAIQGVINGIVQPLIFAKLHDIMGAKNLFLFSVASTLPMIALFPIMNALARPAGVVQGVWLLIGLQVTIASCTGFAYGLSLSLSH